MNESKSEKSSSFYSINRMPPWSLLRTQPVCYTDTKQQRYYDARVLEFCTDICEEFTDEVMVIKAPSRKVLEIPIEGEDIQVIDANGLDYKMEVISSGSGLLMKPGVRSTSFIVLRKL